MLIKNIPNEIYSSTYKQHTDALDKGEKKNIQQRNYVAVLVYTNIGF